MPKIINTKQAGFTLIELLVVVMVISALSGVVVSLVNTGGFRDKAKDAQRVADLKQIQTALELYFSDRRSYPVAANWVEVTGSDTLSTSLSPSYINKMPTDPNGASGQSTPCNNPTSPRYNYITNATGNTYILTATMAIDSSVTGHTCASLKNWGTTGSCAGDLSLCYGVQNP